jgi:hypothetical protein
MRKSNYYLQAARLGAAAVIAALLLAVCQSAPRVGGPDDGEKRRTVRTVVIAESVPRGEVKDDPVEIWDKDGLIAFAAAVLDAPYLDGELMDDIELTATSQWTPIGKEKNNNQLPPTVHEYTGTFNGNGKTISNLNVVENTSYAGLFALNNGVIKNLTVEGTVTATPDTGAPDIDYVAGVAAYNGIEGTIQNVISQVTVIAAPDTTHNIGGIAGFNGYDYYNPDSPYSPAQSNTGKLGDYKTGGVIYRCRNLGNVSGGFNKIGGIAGENAYQITECVNTGTISCSKSVAHGWPGVGGIAGRNGNNNDPTEQGVILNCYNWGLVVDSATQGSAHGGYGGITGWCNQESKVINCYTSTDFQPRSGAKNPIIGMADEPTAGLGNNNYSLDSIYTSDTDVVLTGVRKPDTYMETQDFVDDLNGSSGPYVFVTGGYYPKLDWELSSSN